jgi:hypothetical protein
MCKIYPVLGGESTIDVENLAMALPKNTKSACNGLILKQIAYFVHNLSTGAFPA